MNEVPEQDETNNLLILPQPYVLSNY